MKVTIDKALVQNVLTHFDVGRIHFSEVDAHFKQQRK